MLRLLKTDLLRVIKDKLFIVVCILCVGFALFTPTIYKLLELLLTEDEADILFGSLFQAKDMFYASFSLTNNFGLILPILLSIIICKDFTYGTVRNKIICGHSRTNVFFSVFLTTFITLTGMILIHGLITLGLGCAYFGYSYEVFDAKALKELLLSIVFIILSYGFISALLSFLCVSTKNVGGSIVIYFAVVIGFMLISTILQLGIDVLSFSEDKDVTLEVLQFFQNINIFNNITMVIGRIEYEVENILYLIISPILFITLFVLLGNISFNKKDIK